MTRIQNDTYTYVTIAIKEFVTNPQYMSQITITIGGEFQGAGEISEDSFEVGEKVFVFVKKIGPYYRARALIKVWNNGYEKKSPRVCYQEV